MTHLLTFIIGLALVPLCRHYFMFKVVRFEDGFIIKSHGNGKALEVNSDSAWHASSNQKKYCLFSTKEAAQARLAQYREDNPPVLCRLKKAFREWLDRDCA